MDQFLLHFSIFQTRSTFFGHLQRERQLQAAAAAVVVVDVLKMFSFLFLPFFHFLLSVFTCTVSASHPRFLLFFIFFRVETKMRIMHDKFG
jgi:hypothetical protein